MDDSKKTALIHAANLLIRAPNAHDLYESMVSAAPLMARYRDLRFVGESEPLNALALIKASHPDTFDGVVHLIESKRESAGFDPLNQPDDKFDKAEYMQAFMEQKRMRQRRAADIENVLRPERDRLVGRSRLDFMQRQSAIWKDERDAMLKAARESRGRALKRQEITEVLAAFWAKIDAQLDELEHIARKGAIGIKTHSASLADLEAALKHDPYAK